MINYTTYHHEAFPDVLVLEATGKLDSAAADFMLDCIQGYIERGAKKLVIDCEDLHMITSVGLGMLEMDYLNWLEENVAQLQQQQSSSSARRSSVPFY